MDIKEKIITFISYLLNPQKRKLISLCRKLKSESGIEIGGPSSIFSLKSAIPVYLFAQNVDGVNFSNQTVWEGQIKEGENFNYYKDRTGYQFISEASDLSKIENEKYDFLLSSHCLEHLANPIKALREWNRVLKPNGCFILVLPDKRFTFDHKRPYTTFEHLVQDFEKNTNEQDTTHFNEITSLHDINNDQGIKSKDELIVRVENNFENRCVHHHVFNFELIKEMLHFTGFETEYQQWLKPFHLVTVAKKLTKV